VATHTPALVALSGMDVQERRQLIADAQTAIENTRTSHDRTIRIDCAHVHVVDLVLVGTLTVIARNAQRCGRRVELIEPPSWLRRNIAATRTRPLLTWNTH